MGTLTQLNAAQTDKLKYLYIGIQSKMHYGICANGLLYMLAGQSNMALCIRIEMTTGCVTGMLSTKDSEGMCREYE